MADMKIIITGASGRMGKANINNVILSDNVQLFGAVDKSGTKEIGKDAAIVAGLPPIGVKISDNIEPLLGGAEAIIDFSTPDASVKFAKLAAKNKLIHIIGTTGFSDKQEEEIKLAAKNGAIIVKSGNMSLGINLLVSLVKKTAAILGDDFDVEIVEMHHNKKIDAPSGTALMLGQAAANGRKINLEKNSIKSREGIIGARKRGDIGFATLRGGSVIGEHNVIFAGPSERIELSHKAENRSLFANGAIRAALWAKGKKNGLYSMEDVLAL